MKIDCIKTYFKDENGYENVIYKYRPFKYCCKKIKDFGHIDLVNEYDEYNTDDGLDDDDCIIPRFSIIAEEPEPWEEMAWPTYYKINYCPFCGEKIDINVVKDIDVTDEYLENVRLLNKLKKKQEETDSKKEAEELNRRILTIRSKQDNMWRFGEYHDS